MMTTWRASLHISSQTPSCCRLCCAVLWAVRCACLQFADPSCVVWQIPQFNPAVSHGSPQQAPLLIPTVYPLEVLSSGASNSICAPRKRQRRARGVSAPARTSASMHERPPPNANKEHANQDSIEEMLSTEEMLLRLFPGERGSFREYFCQIASPGEIRVLYLAMCDDAHRDMSLY